MQHITYLCLFMTGYVGYGSIERSPDDWRPYGSIWTARLIHLDPCAFPFITVTIGYREPLFWLFEAHWTSLGVWRHVFRSIAIISLDQLEPNSNTQRLGHFGKQWYYSALLAFPSGWVLDSLPFWMGPSIGVNRIYCFGDMPICSQSGICAHYI